MSGQPRVVPALERTSFVSVICSFPSQIDLSCSYFFGIGFSLTLARPID